MAAATFAIIMGFSFDEHHIAQYGLPGVGYEAFWKRLVTVLLGFIAALIVQIISKPPSATNHVRKSLAMAVHTLADHYAMLVSHWGQCDVTNQDLSGAAAESEQISLEVADMLLSLTDAINLLKVEVSTSPFNQKILAAVQRQCQDMNQALGKLLALTARLPEPIQLRLAGSVGILDDTVVGNVMSVLVMVEKALQTGSPLPERMPTPLLQTCLAKRFAQRGNIEFNMQLVKDDEYRGYCVALSVYIMFLSAIDDLVEVLKDGLSFSYYFLYS